MSAEDTAAIDAGIAAVMEKHPEVPAFYVGLWSPERGSYQQAYGLADVAAERPAGLDDHFRIGSVSKTFGAAIILQLIDEGLLALEDTVADADPALAERFPEVADISVSDLLGMTSGIPDYMNVSDATVAAVTRAPDTQWDPIDLIGYGVERGLAPAGTPGYSTTGYVILQEIAETLTGQTIQELVTERLTEPLGHARHGAAVQRGHHAARAVRARLHESGLQRGAGGRRCRAGPGRHRPHRLERQLWTDRWQHALRPRRPRHLGSLDERQRAALRRARRRAARDARCRPRRPFTYGLGIMQAGTQFGHEGEAIGWEGWAGHDPETGETAVVFTNTCADSGALFSALPSLTRGSRPWPT